MASQPAAFRVVALRIRPDGDQRSDRSLSVSPSGVPARVRLARSRRGRPDTIDSAGRSRRALGVLALAGMIVGVGAVVAVAGMKPSPFVPLQPAGDQTPSFLAALARRLGMDGLSSSSAVAVGFAAAAVLVLGFVFALRQTWLGRVSLGTVVTLSIVFQALMAFLPVLLSDDA